MKADGEQIIDDLLCRWAQWLRPLASSHGYAAVAAGCAGYRTSRQYDDQNGALDESIDHVVMKQVDHEIAQIAQPWCIALHCEARRLVLGVDVFKSPRLPNDREARMAIIAQARSMLSKRLTTAGVI